MSDQPVVFAQTFEGMFLRGLGAELSPALRSRLWELGLDLNQPLAPAYPVQLWVAGLKLAAEHVYPSLPLETAHRQLGERFVTGFTETLVGGAMMALLKVVGFKRALGRMERNFRSGNNFMRTRFVDHGPRDVEVVIESPYEIPAFTEGIFLAGARALRVQGARVVSQPNPEGCSFRITWSDGAG